MFWFAHKILFNIGYSNFKACISMCLCLSSYSLVHEKAIIIHIHFPIAKESEIGSISSFFIMLAFLFQEQKSFQSVLVVAMLSNTIKRQTKNLASNSSIYFHLETTMNTFSYFSSFYFFIHFPFNSICRIANNNR